jgi:hypothetical protein
MLQQFHTTQAKVLNHKQVGCDLLIIVANDSCSPWSIMALLDRTLIRRQHPSLDFPLHLSFKACDICTDEIAIDETRLVPSRNMQRRQTDPGSLLDAKGFVWETVMAECLAIARV